MWGCGLGIMGRMGPMGRMGRNTVGRGPSVTFSPMGPIRPIGPIKPETQGSLPHALPAWPGNRHKTGGRRPERGRGTRGRRRQRPGLTGPPGRNPGPPRRQRRVGETQVGAWAGRRPCGGRERVERCPASLRRHYPGQVPGVVPVGTLSACAPSRVPYSSEERLGCGKRSASSLRPATRPQRLHRESPVASHPRQGSTSGPLSVVVFPRLRSPSGAPPSSASAPQS